MEQIIRVVSNPGDDNPPTLGQAPGAACRVPLSQLLALVCGAAVFVIEHVVKNERMRSAKTVGVT